MHPRGEEIISKYAGRDATAAYKPIHPNNPLEKCLGSANITAEQQLENEEFLHKKTEESIRAAEAQTRKPSPHLVTTVTEDTLRRSVHHKAPRIRPRGCYKGGCWIGPIVQGKRLLLFSGRLSYRRVP